MQCEEGQGCVFFGRRGSGPSMLRRGVNGLCILGETSVFAENQTQSWGGECQLVCWAPGVGLGAQAGLI